MGSPGEWKPMGTSHIPLKCDRGLGTSWGRNLVPGAFWAGSLGCQRGHGNSVYPGLVVPALPILPSPNSGSAGCLSGSGLTFHYGVSDLKTAALYWVGAPSCIFPYPRGLPVRKAFLKDPIEGNASSYLPSLFVPFKSKPTTTLLPASCPCLLCHRIGQVLHLGLVAHFPGAWGGSAGGCGLPERRGPCASLWCSGVSLMVWKGVLGTGTGMMIVSEGPQWPEWRAVW